VFIVVVLLLSGFAAAPREAVLRMPGGGCLRRAVRHVYVAVSRQEVLVFHQTGGWRRLFVVSLLGAILKCTFRVSQDVEREITFQGGSGLYYFYYKHMLTAPSFEKGTRNTTSNRTLAWIKSWWTLLITICFVLSRLLWADARQRDGVRSDDQRSGAFFSVSGAHLKLHIQSHWQPGEDVSSVWSAPDLR